MNFFYEYLLFLAKAITIVVACGLLLMLVIGAKAEKYFNKKKGQICFENISDYFEQLKESFHEIAAQEMAEEETTLSDKTDRAEKKWWQFWKKHAKTEGDKQGILYVIDFDGDIAAHAAQGLRMEISALLNSATAEDEVLIRLKSPGGVVNGYGLAASQLVRIRERGLPLTIAVDEVAASGGYLMACVADKIIASPFALIGSIGVVAQLPNFHKLLEKFDIDYEQFTAGKYKRTVTMFGENSDEAREKFKQELEEIHDVFKDFVVKYRTNVDIERLATGEHWLGIKAKELGLVDELKTSDAFIQDALATRKIISVEYVEKKSVRDNISSFLNKLNARISV